MKLRSRSFRCVGSLLLATGVVLSALSVASVKCESEQAAKPAAENSAHHFDRVLIVVLENGDYEAAVKDANLAALAAQGASFTNFHALFHPSYPNYLAMVAGTDFRIGSKRRLLADFAAD